MISTNELAGQLAIVIPTYNQYVRLQRLLGYLDFFALPVKIFVLDSSEDKTGAQRINFLQGNPQVDYSTYDSSISVIDKIKCKINEIVTPYVVLCADDDFISPQAICRCIDFLENNGDYVAAQGRTVGFNQNVDGKVQIVPVGFYARNLDVDSGEVAQRVETQFAYYHNFFYAVQRTSLLKTFVEGVTAADFQLGLFFELSHSFVLAFAGKSRVLPVFYSAREMISGSSGDQAVPLHAITSDAGYREKYAHFRGVLSKICSDVGKMPYERASAVVAKGIEAYLNEFCPRYNNGLGSHGFRHVPNTGELRGEVGYPVEPDKSAIIEWGIMRRFIDSYKAVFANGTKIAVEKKGRCNLAGNRLETAILENFNRAMENQDWHGMEKIALVFGQAFPDNALARLLRLKALQANGHLDEALAFAKRDGLIK